ncbi:hypothetical protein PoHVEF18_005432 [Penicillium ochrochloron]
MASNKDMRRADLVSIPIGLTWNDAAAIPYVDPPKSANDGDMSSTMSSTMPMAATWLAESPEQKKTAATPAYMSVFMSLMALVVTYFPMFLPPQVAKGTAAAPPAPSPSP